MGIWDVIKKKLTLEEGRHHGNIDDSIGKNVFEIAAFDMEKATLDEKMSYILNNRSQGEQIQLADKLLKEGPYEASIEMYEALIRKYPEERDRYENGMGTAYLKLGRYEDAIQSYLNSRNHGMHPLITDKNIWEACRGQFESTSDLKFIEDYQTHCPQGKYSAQAQALLQGESLEVVMQQLSVPTPPVDTVVTESAPIHPIQEEISTEFNEDQNLEDVAKKNKIVDENQISLFTSNEDEQKAETPDTPLEKEESLESQSVESFAPEEEISEESQLENEIELEVEVQNEETIEEEEVETNIVSDEIEEEYPMDQAPNMLLALDHHVDSFFKNEDVVVWQDKRNDELRIDVFHIKPNEERDYHILLSYGMSRQPMQVPENAEQFKYGELAMILPKEWDLSREGLKDSNNYWPILWLKNLARIPVQHNSWLCYGHSVPHGNPPKPIANTEFEGVVIMDSVTLAEEFQEMQLGEDSLFIYTVIPVFREEMEFKIEQGIDELRNAFAQAGIIDIINTQRPSAIIDHSDWI